MRQRGILLCFVVALMGQPVLAQTAGNLHIWASPAVYGLESSSCGRPQGRTPADDIAMIAPAFCAELKRLQPVIAERFVQLVLARLPGAQARFGEHLAVDATARARLAGTAVASLRISRATISEVPKPGSVEGHMLITLTLDISNAGTGEVLFTHTLSDDAYGNYTPEDLEKRLLAALPGHIDATLGKLIDEAAAAWRPYPISATVRGESDGQWVVDAGRQAGLRAGDSIGEDGRILYAGADYAIVKPILGAYKPGQTLLRTATQPVEMLARPSLLSIIATAPNGYARNYLAQIFEDALGKSGHFAPVPVNVAMIDIRARAIGDAGATSDETRSLPDYIARISIAALAPFSVPSNVPGVRIGRHEAHIFVELIAPSGRVLATVHEFDRITDEVAAGISFSADQRRDTVIRNALTKAAKSLSALRATSVMLPISRVDGAFLISDQGGTLSLGQQVVVLRRLGRMGSIADVRIPVGQLRVDTVNGTDLLATDVGVEPLRFRTDDMAIIDMAGPTLQTRRAVGQCREPDGSSRIDWRGDARPALWQVAAGPLFGGRFAGPVFIPSLPEELAPLADSFAGWKQMAAAKVRAIDYCFTPVLALSATSQGPRSLTVGYTLHRGETRLTGGAVQVQMTLTALPAGTRLEMLAAALDQDFAAVALPLAEKAAAALTPPADSEF